METNAKLKYTPHEMDFNERLFQLLLLVTDASEGEKEAMNVAQTDHLVAWYWHIRDKGGGRNKINCL